ncbi:MAG: flagellar biosynthesis anti-sigma factor FlgM [Armatimonadetes bacterium]|nr:flagellar biosynthesis anti-sigma factor FlgM [Armatimonadota bacterium]MBX3108636.1 flagellar biosynthesis anti-sigma factor FlgM [Fimbriimonadaceae bacterium]
MKISNQQIEEIKKGNPVSQTQVDAAVIRLTDANLISELTAKVNEMPDRDEMVAELKAKIESAAYHPTGEEIADTMIRRAIADRITQ